MCLALIGKNLKGFLTAKTFLFFFIIISQIVCVAATLSVAGMLDAISPQPVDERGWSTKSFFVDLQKQVQADQNSQGDEPMTYKIYDRTDKKLIYEGTDKEKYQKYMRELTLKYADSDDYHEIEVFEIPGSAKSEEEATYISYKALKPRLLRFLKENGSQLSGFELHVKSQEVPATYLAVGGNTLEGPFYAPLKQSPNAIIIQRSRDNIRNSPLEELEVKDTITIGSTAYTVAKIEKYATAAQIIVSLPYTALDDSFTVESLIFTINDDVEQEGIARLYDDINKTFGDQGPHIESPIPPTLMDKQFNNMIYVLSVIMVAAVILNVARLYAYMMSTRRKTLAVFSLCGSSRKKITTVYMAEIILTMLFSFAVGCALFHFGIRNAVAGIFPTFQTFFTPLIYLLIFAIYMVVGTIIMTLNIIPIIKKSVNDLTKGGE